MRDKEYIKNLTENLIGKNRYWEVPKRIPDKKKLLRHIKLDLECGDVQDMKPETLGKIICSFKEGAVAMTQAEIFEGIHFSGNCGEMLRELTAVCLAHVIVARLEAWNYMVSMGDVHISWKQSLKSSED